MTFMQEGWEQMDGVAKLVRYHRRLTGLSPLQKLYYIVNVLYGEIFRTRSIGPFGLRLVEISLTDRCQCRCVHCYAATRKPVAAQDELTTQEIFELLGQMAAMRISEVCFSGGEPLLRKDIVDLVKYARWKGVLPKINTNGILLTESLVLKLKEAGLAWCLVSIDSAQPSQHDALRKYIGCYSKAVEGLRRLVRYGIPASIVTYARKESIYNGNLAEIVALGHELRVDTVRVLFPVPMGRFEDAYKEMLTLEEREEVRKLLKDPIVTMESPREITRCTAGVTKLNIMTNGDVTPCVFIPLPFGNVRQESLREIWEAMAEFACLGKPRGQCPMSAPAFRGRLLSQGIGMPTPINRGSFEKIDSRGGLR